MRDLVHLVDFALAIYVWLVFASAVASWLIGFGALDGGGRVVSAIRRWLSYAVEPLLRPLRPLIPKFGGLDFSPVVAIMLIMALRYVIALFILRNL